MRFLVRDARGARWVDTTVGRVLFNSIMPPALGFQNRDMKKKALSELVFESYRKAGLAGTVQFLDRLKEFGFRHATRGGVSIGIEDLEIPARQGARCSRRPKTRVERFQKAYQTGNITNGERYNKVIDTWTHANNDIADAMVKTMAKAKNGFNPVFMMFDSGSRGSRDQIRQLAGMRGLMAKPQKKLTGGIGEIIESPIKSNFREGLSVLEYFISTHGARKGLADTALKTADAGYLTRRLVDVAQDVTITEEDCGTILGPRGRRLKEGEDIIEPLSERIVGNVAAEDVEDPHEIDETGRRTLLVEAGQLIARRPRGRSRTPGSRRFASAPCSRARRSAGCAACATAATWPRWTWSTSARRSASSPRSRSASRARSSRCARSTSAARRLVSPSRRRGSRKVAGVIEYGDRLSLVTNPEGQKIVTSYEGEIIIRADDGQECAGASSRLPGAARRDPDGQGRRRDRSASRWSSRGTRTPTRSSPTSTGTIRFVDIVEDETVSEELDELTGLRQRVIIEDREKKLHPHIEIVQDEGRQGEAHPRLRDPGGRAAHRGRRRARSPPGTIIAKISREAYKTRDITGGLPRVAELFEARRPKDPATISEIDGVVRFGEIKRGKREIFVQPLKLGDGNRPSWTTAQPSRSCTKCRPASTCACTRATACAPATGCRKVRSTRTTSCGSRDRARCRSTC